MQDTDILVLQSKLNVSPRVKYTSYSLNTRWLGGLGIKEISLTADVLPRVRCKVRCGSVNGEQERVTSLFIFEMPGWVQAHMGVQVPHPVVMRCESFDPVFASLYDAGMLVWEEGFKLVGINVALPVDKVGGE